MISLRSLLVFTIFIAASQPCLLHASTCTPTVSSGDSIQSAIDAASSGDTICIGVGTYTENLTLKDGVKLNGEELARTIINGGGSGAVITGSGLISATYIYNITIRNGETGLSLSSVTSLTVSNVIIAGNGTGISSSDSTFTVTNTVIDQNSVSGIDCPAPSTITLQNSILTNNATDISGTITLSPSYNLTNGNTTKNYTSTNYPDDTHTLFDQDPLFVDTASNDYHLKSGSPAIDMGSGTDTVYDNSIADIGAYGGSNMDVTPFPVFNVSATASATDANALDLTWSANNAYNINDVGTESQLTGGYKIYFDSDASGTPYEGSSAEGTSPIDVGNVTSYTLSGLTATATAPEPPTGLMTAPGNETISVSWSAVAGATGYIVYWGTSSGSYTQSADAGNTTSYTIQGLTNGTMYYIAVSAYTPTYYVAVTAYDNSDSKNESVLISETSVLATESLKSVETSEYPEESVPFPNLKDEGLCFIATAAYGSNMEPDVVTLRKFRDHYLLTNPIGRGFTALYYRYSPPMADFIRDHELLKSIVRAGLLPFVLMAKLLLSTTLALKLLLFMSAAFLTASLVLAKRRKLS